MTSTPDVLRVARTRECNTQQMSQSGATSAQQPAQQNHLKALAQLALARNNPRNKPAVHASESAQQQAPRLAALAQAAGLPVAVTEALSPDDLAACSELPDSALTAYLRALDRGRIMDRGSVPEGYTQPSHCEGCGPVWLWEGAPRSVLACPWCFRRAACRPIPRPPVTCGRCRHYQRDPLNPAQGTGKCALGTGKARWPAAAHVCPTHAPATDGGQP
jgi:hypothetical protein